MGLEMEMVVADASTGESRAVDGYFAALQAIKQARGKTIEAVVLDGRSVALHTPEAECGLDNGFNLLETALAPVDADANGLDTLSRRAHRELADTLDALDADRACVLNASQHPACRRDRQWYAQLCVPRPIYHELRDYRGWHHWEGIDAKAQNGANTSVPVSRAIEALNVAIGLAPASIALFANSPIESGVVTGFKENRMTLWPRMFGPARFAGDMLLCSYPSRPFYDLSDFFLWMFGPDTVTRGLPLAPSYDYKTVPTVLPDGDPCLLALLTASRWPGRRTDTGEAVMLAPHAHHFEYSQIGQFLDARLRYRFGEPLDLPELMAAWQRDGGLEALFESSGMAMYIEARAPGAGFADARLLRDAGAEAAQSILMSPSALQAGLLANLDAARALVRDWGWQALGALREPAMRRGLDDDGVRALCTDVLAVAAGGLGRADRHWLAYCDFVLDSGRTAADRMLDTWTSAGGREDSRLAAVLRQHRVLRPDAFGARLAC
jgi:gamma-glutamylcysteine synthetase